MQYRAVAPDVSQVQAIAKRLGRRRVTGAAPASTDATTMQVIVSESDGIVRGQLTTSIDLKMLPIESLLNARVHFSYIFRILSCKHPTDGWPDHGRVRVSLIRSHAHDVN